MSTSDPEIKSSSLLGVTDLTLIAPIKPGLIPALDARTYVSRVRLLLGTLNALRISSREVDPTPLIVDTVGRIRAVHSFRLALVGTERLVGKEHLLLAVTFDGGWETYMRRIWRDLGPLLDVIFCNCEDYPGSHDNDYPTYIAWVRKYQVRTEFFYNATPTSVHDLHYLRGTERQRRDSAPPGPTAGSLFEQAMPAIGALYRLSDMFPPGVASNDDACLRRAARHLLPEVVTEIGEKTWPDGRTPAERAAIAWFSKDVDTRRKKPQDEGFAASAVQSGIVRRHQGMTHGCLLLLSLDGPAAAQALLEHVTPDIVSAQQQDEAQRGYYFNLSFSFEGLRAAGVPEATLVQLPQEFREGMARRFGTLGDRQYNHPTRWRLPVRNWPAPPAGTPPQRVPISQVHAVLQISIAAPGDGSWQELVGDPTHPLHLTVSRLDQALRDRGVRLLSVQAMQSGIRASGEPAADPAALPRDHFGFADGISQPTLDGESRTTFKDRVLPGDLLLGRTGTLGDPMLSGRLWTDGSFLVVRKLKQEVKALYDQLPADPAAADEIKARMMGRWPDGRNLIDGTTGNDFDYDGDPAGRRCPLHAHVRRANPRRTGLDLKTLPRILRRGMSYGPRWPDGGDEAERGLVFMAYNASIAEQFEVVQAWLSGGNAPGDGAYSAVRDPFLGVPVDGDPTHHDLGDGRQLALDRARPLVRLEWGLYLFVPSLPALAELRALAREAADRPVTVSTLGAALPPERAAEVARGAAVIAGLRQLEATAGLAVAAERWKITLEDMSARMAGISAAVWTAIRHQHGGVLRTPHGVLVAGPEQVDEVFRNAQGRYSVSGYLPRMQASFGGIYLGLDQGDTGSLGGQGYAQRSRVPNDEVMKVSRREAFRVAHRATGEALGELLAGLKPPRDRSIDVRDWVDAVLAKVSRHWFGLPDGQHVVDGGWHWRDAPPPSCPGHFQSPSRYMFQPRPGPQAAEVGRQHGQALKTAALAFVRACRGDPKLPRGHIGAPIFDAHPDTDAENEQLASTLIGVMMGFLPTVDGNLRGALWEWVEDRSLWALQAAYLAHAGADDAFERAGAVLLKPLTRTMQLRPVPEVVWRTVLEPHTLAGVPLAAGDTVVVGIVSAMRALRDGGSDDLYPVFGGNRRGEAAPTHACPGYEMAMGVMLGMLAGLLDGARLRPTLSSLALNLAPRR